MLAKTRTCALVGLDGVVVETEVDIARGFPAFHIVGLADVAVQESKERVRAAIRNSGVEFPMRRIAVSLAPADVRNQDQRTICQLPLGYSQVPGRFLNSIQNHCYLESWLLIELFERHREFFQWWRSESSKGLNVRSCQ